MNSGLRTEIKAVALGYGLQYKISNRRTKYYLVPHYRILRRNHPELLWEEFIGELIRVRQEEKNKLGPAAYEFKEYGVMACLDAISR